MVIELRPGGQIMSKLPLALCRAEIKLRNVWFIPLLKNCVSVIAHKNSHQILCRVIQRRTSSYHSNSVGCGNGAW